MIGQLTIFSFAALFSRSRFSLSLFSLSFAILASVFARTIWCSRSVMIASLFASAFAVSISCNVLCVGDGDLVCEWLEYGEGLEYGDGDAGAWWSEYICICTLEWYELNGEGC